MKTNLHLCAAVNTAIVLLSTTATAFAADTSKVYVSKIGILLFLGSCALVVAVQLIPAIMTLYGMLKGASNERAKSPSRAKSH